MYDNLHNILVVIGGNAAGLAAAFGAADAGAAAWQRLEQLSALAVENR